MLCSTVRWQRTESLLLINCQINRRTFTAPVFLLVWELLKSSELNWLKQRKLECARMCTHHQLKRPYYTWNLLGFLQNGSCRLCLVWPFLHPFKNQEWIWEDQLAQPWNRFTMLFWGSICHFCTAAEVAIILVGVSRPSIRRWSLSGLSDHTWGFWAILGHFRFQRRRPTTLCPPRSVRTFLMVLGFQLPPLAFSPGRKVKLSR